MHRSSLVLTLGVLFALLAATAGAQTSLMRGTVVDDAGEPLPGVQVTVTSEELGSFNQVLTTNKRGEFRIRFQPTHAQYVFQFLFEKSGYESFTQPLSPSVTRAMDDRFVMHPAETQVVEARGDLSAVVTGSSNAAVAAFNAGLTAQRAGDLDTARERYGEALAADPDLGPAHIALAQVLIDLQDYSGAAASADRALALTGSRAEALRVKHQALRALGRHEEADAVATEMAEAEGSEALARRMYNEGGEAFQAGDQDTALAHFTKAAELDPSLVDAHHAIAVIEFGRGNHEAAAESAERALDLGSDDVRTLRVLYDAYDALGRTEEVAEIAPRLAQVDPDFGGSKLVEQAAQLWNAGQADRAVALSRLALTIDPTLAKPYYFIGLAHVSKGENAEARAALQKFVDMAPDDPEAGTAREMLAYVE